MTLPCGPGGVSYYDTALPGAAPLSTDHTPGVTPLHTPHNGFQNDINVKGVYYIRLVKRRSRVSREHVAPSPFTPRIDWIPKSHARKKLAPPPAGITERIYCLLLPVCYKHRLEA